MLPQFAGGSLRSRTPRSLAPDSGGRRCSVMTGQDAEPQPNRYGCRFQGRSTANTSVWVPHYVSMGQLPNRFPDEGQAPEYNTVDATLWYFEAIRAYREATGDDALLRDLFPMLQEIVDWHVRGIRTQIHVDPADGLLYAGELGVQLTWMDAKVDDWVVTPRNGKPVEVNALWQSALSLWPTSHGSWQMLIGEGLSAEPLSPRSETFGDQHQGEIGEGLLTEPISPRSETFGDREKPTRPWRTRRGPASPASGARRPAAAPTCSTAQTGTTPRCAPTSSSPCHCPTARCSRSNRRPWWTPARGTCSPPTSCAAWTLAIPTIWAATAATGARTMQHTTRARCGLPDRSVRERRPGGVP